MRSSTSESEKIEKPLTGASLKSACQISVSSATVKKRSLWEAAGL